jgi:hypothetical protein
VAGVIVAIAGFAPRAVRSAAGSKLRTKIENMTISNGLEITRPSIRVIEASSFLLFITISWERELSRSFRLTLEVFLMVPLVALPQQHQPEDSQEARI